ncbi:MAG TPA: hypothetical protein ENG31_03145 [Candidatus Thorarchaeota archaeon]|nr:hypothetical protein [Candidatus Thorarchaeota archaeon]
MSLTSRRCRVCQDTSRRGFRAGQQVHLCKPGAEGDTRGYQGAATWSYKQPLPAGRAATILQRGRYPIEALAARIMQDKCTRCGMCAKRCPCGAIV